MSCSVPVPVPVLSSPNYSSSSGSAASVLCVSPAERTSIVDASGSVSPRTRAKIRDREIVSHFEEAKPRLQESIEQIREIVKRGIDVQQSGQIKIAPLFRVSGLVEDCAEKMDVDVTLEFLPRIEEEVPKESKRLSYWIDFLTMEIVKGDAGLNRARYDIQSLIDEVYSYISRQRADKILQVLTEKVRQSGELWDKERKRVIKKNPKVFIDMCSSLAKLGIPDSRELPTRKRLLHCITCSLMELYGEIFLEVLQTCTLNREGIETLLTRLVIEHFLCDPNLALLNVEGKEEIVRKAISYSLDFRELISAHPKGDLFEEEDIQEGDDIHE